MNVTLSGTTITQDFTLTATPTELTGVVVTALGQSREKSQVGTAVQQVSAQELTQTKARDIVSRSRARSPASRSPARGAQVDRA